MVVTFLQFSLRCANQRPQPAGRPAQWIATRRAAKWTWSLGAKISPSVLSEFSFIRSDVRNERKETGRLRCDHLIVHKSPESHARFSTFSNPYIGRLYRIAQIVAGFLIGEQIKPCLRFSIISNRIFRIEEIGRPNKFFR